ncbi:MAG: GDP-mannose 4,6-dehydratase [Marmoricola sp.]
MTRHLVTGASGHDGRLLVGLLAAANDPVVACRRPGSPLLAQQGVVEAELDVTDVDAFARLVREHAPDAVHNLAAISSVQRSWDDEEAVVAVDHGAVVAMLDVLVDVRPGCRFVQASSSEIFGPVPSGVADEETPLAPVSPYGRAKAAAHRAVVAARGALDSTNLVLFGHTGPGHAHAFVLPTIARQAAAVAAGLGDAVELRDPAVARDWGAARDFVRAFPLAADGPAGDYVIATGRLHRLDEIARWALEAAGVQAEVRAAPGHRPADFGGVRGVNRRAAEVLGWRPEVTLREEIDTMVAHAAAELAVGGPS